MIPRCLSACTSPVQAVRLKIERGLVIANHQRLTDVVLWADTSPPVVEIAIEPNGEHHATLKVWNAWRDDGVMQAWFGDAGMIVEESSAGLWLRCSDGVGEMDFSDVVFEVSFSLPPT